ncbi:hypothetical protein [Nocardioides litoris]|uniref:hypothetical protein n=1 Tax=Nocardioides litoris TaxID=1926648 RepID=UPI001120E58A|nr:hypothetical protein [Nocardioides litoris]
MSAGAVVLTSVLVLHLLAIVVLMVLVVLERLRVPRGAVWIALLLLVPVLGPLMVLLAGRDRGAADGPE